MRYSTFVVTGLMIVSLLSPVFTPGASRARTSDGAIDDISSVPRKARLALFRAYEARGNGDYQASTRILQSFVEKNPGDDHFLIRFHLATSMAQTSDLEAQIEQLQKCVELEPRYAKGWLSLGEIAYNAERYELAADALGEGFRRSDEKKAQVLYYSSAAYLMAEKPEKAIPQLEVLTSGMWGEPKLDWFRAQVSAALQAEDTEAGKRAVDSMLERFEDSPDAWTLAFQYAAATGDYEQAAVALTIKGYLVPLTREEEIQLGDLYSAIEVPERATRSYNTAMDGEATTGELERLASAYLAAHDPDAALRTLTRALEQEPTPRLWSLHGDLNFMQERYDDAYEAYRKSTEMDPEGGRAYLMMAYCAMELGNKDEAKNQLKMAAGYPDQSEKAAEILEKIDTFMQ
jgi:tetratricopeptide (TPR) repeat protein